MNQNNKIVGWTYNDSEFLWDYLWASMTSSSENFAGWIKKKIADLNKKKKQLESWIKQTIKLKEEAHWPLAWYFLQKPSSEYNDYDNKIAAANPDLLALSKQVDWVQSQIWDLDKDIINLDKAYWEITWAYDNQENAINKAADTWLNAIGIQKATQSWWMQWLAGKQWATTWMLAKGTAEIENAFAPKELWIEEQRQKWLAAVNAARASVPSQMSAMQWQNIQNQYSREKLNKYMNQVYSAYSPYTSTTTPATVVPETVQNTDERNAVNESNNWLSGTIESTLNALKNKNSTWSTL